jgi:hypothetical protein
MGGSVGCLGGGGIGIAQGRGDARGLLVWREEVVGDVLDEEALVLLIKV